MRMIVIALIGGALIGFLTGALLAGTIQEWVTSPSQQPIAIAAVAASLGALWGWMGKGLVGSRGKD
jgi:hypothetical protein